MRLDYMTKKMKNAPVAASTQSPGATALLAFLLWLHDSHDGRLNPIPSSRWALGNREGCIFRRIKAAWTRRERSSV